MQPKKVYHSPVSALLIFFVVVVVGGVGWFWTKPTISQVSADRAAVAGYRTLSTNADTQLKNLDALKAGLTTTKAAVDELNLAYPRDASLPEVLVQLQAISSQSQMKVNSLSVDTSDKAGGVPISLSTTGTFDQLRSFLQLLESSRRPISVQSIALSGAADGSLTSTFTLAMLFVGSNADQTPAGATPAPQASATP